MLGITIELSRGYGHDPDHFHDHRRVRGHDRCRGPCTRRNDDRYRADTPRAHRRRETAFPSQRVFPNRAFRPDAGMRPYIRTVDRILDSQIRESQGGRETRDLRQ